jgi:predicted ATPase
MIDRLAIAGYRSLRDIRPELGQLTLVNGANGSGKSSLYRALRLLADVAQGRLVPSLAADGGLASTLWTGPEKFSRSMISGEMPVQGTRRSVPVSLRMGWSSDDYGYAIDLGLPIPSRTMFSSDPEIKPDGSDLAAAIQTIREVVEDEALAETIEDAFPGMRLSVVPVAVQLDLQVQQHGLLRPLGTAELSDGTLRYLMLAAVLLSPRPSALLVLNEPESSLHPDLLAPLARLIAAAAMRSQIIVVSHAEALAYALHDARAVAHIRLEKRLGETIVAHADPAEWTWPLR